MDEADIGNANAEQFLRDALRSRPAPGCTGASRKQCFDCGRAIPDGRRAAQPGCTRCVACQSRFEKGVK